MSIIKTKQYFLFTMFVIMPINGYVAYDNPYLGLFLILLQLPYWIMFSNEIFDQG